MTAVAGQPTGAPDTRRMPGAAARRRAFTLIELLMVTSVIVLLVGGVALALGGRSGEGAALKTAQSHVSGLLGTARAQAALHQTKARLVVYAQQPPGANADSAKYLRSFVVVREDPADSNRWVAVADTVTLPAGICVVPIAPVPANHQGLPQGQSWNNNVQMGPVSTFTALNGFSYRGQSGATANQFFGVTGQSGRVFYLEFQPDGTLTPPAGLPNGTPIKIALGTAVLASNAPPRFNNREGVRGVIIRRTGAVSLVHGSTGF